MKRKSITVISAFCGLGLLLLAPLPAKAQDPAVGGTKRCNDYWHAHRTTLKAAGKTKKDFMGPCLSGTWVFQ